MTHLDLLVSTSSRPGADRSLTIPFTRLPCAVGRSSSCGLRLNDLVISRRHCAFSLRDGQVWVEDLGSRNGTRLNGEPVAQPRQVVDGDALQLASFTFLVRLQDDGLPQSEAVAETSAAQA
jgi:pSer/pThr/pTyr-binding forkhead associated (FHA) protein